MIHENCKLLTQRKMMKTYRLLMFCTGKSVKEDDMLKHCRKWRLLYRSSKHALLICLCALCSNTTNHIIYER